MLARFGGDGKVLAGGHSLVPMMKLRLAQPKHLVDVAGLAELKGIRKDDGMLVIGAGVTEQEVIASALLQRECPLIPEAAQLIADPQVRYLGTIGGDVAHGDPGNDHPAVMLALGAIFVLRGPKGVRRVAASAFYRSLFETELQPDEILTEIRVPTPPPGTGQAYQKLKRKVGDFAIAAAAVSITLKDGRCAKAGIALSNLGPTAIKVTKAEVFLQGRAIDDAAIEQAAKHAIEAADPASDMRGPAAYRKQMAGEMTRRALRLARQRAMGG
jgi:carbon-monoxide dehydrogenase medium subunit